MTTEERLEDIKKRIAKASQEEARAEIVRQNMSERLTAAQKALKEEFSVASVEEARELRQSLLNELADDITAIEEVLDGLEA